MDRERIVRALYELAERLDGQLSSLREESDQLFGECELARQRKLPWADPSEMEKRYWRIQEGIHNLEAREEEILSAIEEVEAGHDIDVLAVAPELEPLFNQPPKATSKTEEGEERVMWYDLYPIDPWASQHVQHRNGRFSRTGRRQTHVTGSFSPGEAEFAFTLATQDTHGGKVRGGSKAGKGTYVTRSGKTVRKY